MKNKFKGKNIILYFKITLIFLSETVIKDYKIVKKILDWPGIYEFERKRPPPKVEEDLSYGSREYIIDDYTECDHVC